MVCEDRAPDVGVILRTGMAGQKGSPRHIGMIAGNGVSPQVGTLVHIGIIAGDGVIEDPGVIARFIGQVALALHEASQIPGLDLSAHIPQRTDAVEEGVFFMGDAGDFVFVIRRAPSSPLFTQPAGAGPLADPPGEMPRQYQKTAGFG